MARRGGRDCTAVVVIVGIRVTIGVGVVVVVIGLRDASAIRRGY